MNWGEFKAAVIEELGVDGNRRGIDALRTRAMRDAVVDLQRYIRAFREGHRTVFKEVDLTPVNFAHLGSLPDHAKPKAFYIVSTGETVTTGVTDNPDCVRNRLDYVPWKHRQSMICDQWGVRRYQYTISPYSREFMVHPLVNDESYLLLVWDGIKMTFDDTDEVPFPEHAAEAVAAYVKWKILQEVDRRSDVANTWYNPERKTGIYPNLRLALAREQRESQDADGNDEEYPNAMQTISGFGAQYIPFLNKITKLSGLDGDITALSAIQTVYLVTPFPVEFDIGGVRQAWELQTSTTATGPGAQRPNDYDGVNNTKVWIQVA